MDRFVRSVRSVRSVEQSIPGTNSSTHQRLYGLSLRANFAWTFVGNVIYAGCQWGILVVLAKMGNPEAVGSFALALAVTAPVIMLANLQLRAVQATDARHEYLFGHYLTLRLIMTALAIAAIALIAFVSSYTPSVVLVILVVGLAKCFEAISDVIYGLLQQHERMDKIAISMTIKGVISLVALAAGIYLTGDLLWGVVALAVSWAGVMFVYDLPNAALIKSEVRHVRGDHGDDPARSDVDNGLRPIWAPGRLIRLVGVSLPLGVVMFLISLNTNIPRYFIEHYLGTRELGFFAAIAYLLVAGSTVVNALGQSASPRLSRLYAAGDRAAFSTLLLKLASIGALIGVVGVLAALTAGRLILQLLYKSEYADYSDVFIWLMVAAGLSYVAAFLGYGMTAARYFRSQTPLFLLVAAATAGGCAILVPAYHLAGAAVAVVFATAVQFLGSLIVVIHAINHNKERTS